MQTVLGEMMQCYRTHHFLTVRQLALRLKTSHATISRIERGLPYDLATAKKLLAWLDSPAKGT